MKMKKCMLAMLLVPFLLLIGCTKQPTQVDNFYGTSFELAKQSQIHDLNAGKDVAPVEGLEGSVGTRVMKRYEGSFEATSPKTETYSISVDGIETK
ncbi:hypothetical protein [Desulfotalea psychrophila]|uniref:Lipoprotein n=1 Tax=Desulfotalea psychrophila (strain LSv54 / DSM 12343) TaxID=177439 RepID=Q6AN11_DESPS|nr:hypothetical protein [Desulfotalea psychrophila]CAG36263.1 hypothetical protein DP1534 [Desulfotalea psychrophila LSv54]